MSYRIDATVPVFQEVRRILDEEIGAAVADLRRPGGPNADDVHDARRRIKKVRSLLRLVRAEVGPSAVRLANGELRAIAGSLSARRDLDARVECAQELIRHARPDELPALQALEQGLAAEAAAGAAALDHSVVFDAVSGLNRTRAWLSRIPPRHDGWPALGPGFVRQYRRGKSDFEALPAAPTDDELHDWRKRAKDLWYHARLLKPIWPEGMRPTVRAASHLADLLGDDHDLALLAVAATTVDGLGDQERATALAAISRRRAHLQAKARRLGALLYADSPEAWESRHRAWWEAAEASADPASPTTNA